MPIGPFIPSKILARVKQSARRLGYAATWADTENERLLIVRDVTHACFFGAGWYPIWPFNRAVVAKIASDKELTGRLLTAGGLRVPTTVCGYIEPTDEPAFIKNPRYIRDVIKKLPFEFPVVVKPNRSACGKGIAVVTRAADLKKAVAVAADYDNQILIQEFVEGNDYRLYVLEGRPVLLVERRARPIISDGKRTVAQHLETAGKRHLRHDGGRLLSYESFINTYGKKILPAGTVINAYPVTNRARGGGVASVSLDWPKAWGEMGVRAAKTIGADFCAVDFRANGEGAPVILELNTSPNVMAVFDADERTGEGFMDLLVKRALQKYSLPF